MFTGIIEAIAKVTFKEMRGGDMRLRIEEIEKQSLKVDWSKVNIGDSIATNGVCLTVVKLFDNGYEADVSTETIEWTTVSQWQLGAVVNLEQALMPHSRLGGHIVSGHVDGIGEVIEMYEDARAWRYKIAAPKSIAKYIAHKGSITVDGISLTVNAVQDNIFELTIVPHTLQETIISGYCIGTKVNLEVDVIARYLERLLSGNNHDESSSSITRTLLAENGYIN